MRSAEISAGLLKSEETIGPNLDRSNQDAPKSGDIRGLRNMETLGEDLHPDLDADLPSNLRAAYILARLDRDGETELAAKVRSRIQP